MRAKDMIKVLQIFMAILCAAGSSALAAKPSTILALGDSITQRTDSYRSILVPALTTNGFSFEFIGPKKDAISSHAGYSGENTKYLLSISKEIYTKYPADIVLLHSGHNSFSKDNPVRRVVVDTKAIIETIKSINPKVTIFLAQVIPSGKLPKYSYIPDLNKELEILSQHLTTKDSQVISVDLASGFDWKTDTVSDRVHPNASGAKKMAAKWMHALSPLLDKK